MTEEQSKVATSNLNLTEAQRVALVNAGLIEPGATSAPLVDIANALA